MSTWHQRREDLIEECCQQLVEQQVVEPLSTDERDTRDWNLCELASLIEGHFQVQLDVARFTDLERLAYERRCTYNNEPLLNPHGGYRRPFWLLDKEGQRAGTIAIDTIVFGIALISLSSLYVEPAARRHKIARRALEALYRASIETAAEVFGSTRTGAGNLLSVSMPVSVCGSGCGNTTWYSPGNRTCRPIVSRSLIRKHAS